MRLIKSNAIFLAAAVLVVVCQPSNAAVFECLRVLRDLDRSIALFEIQLPVGIPKAASSRRLKDLLKDGVQADEVPAIQRLLEERRMFDRLVEIAYQLAEKIYSGSFGAKSYVLNAAERKILSQADFEKLVQNWVAYISEWVVEKRFDVLSARQGPSFMWAAYMHLANAEKEFPEFIFHISDSDSVQIPAKLVAALQGEPTMAEYVLERVRQVRPLRKGLMRDHYSPEGVHVDEFRILIEDINLFERSVREIVNVLRDPEAVVTPKVRPGESTRSREKIHAEAIDLLSNILEKVAIHVATSNALQSDEVRRFSKAFILGFDEIVSRADKYDTDYPFGYKLGTEGISLVGRWARQSLMNAVWHFQKVSEPSVFQRRFIQSLRIDDVLRDIELKAQTDRRTREILSEALELQAFPSIGSFDLSRAVDRSMDIRISNWVNGEVGKMLRKVFSPETSFEGVHELRLQILEAMKPISRHPEIFGLYRELARAVKKEP